MVISHPAPVTPTTAFPVPDAATLAHGTFGADLHRLGAQHVGAQGADLVATFADEDTARVARTIVREELAAPKGAEFAFQGVKLLATPGVGNSYFVPLSSDQVTRAIGVLDGVKGVQYLDALQMYQVSTTDQAAADRLAALLRTDIDGVDLVIAPELVAYPYQQR